jgi:hypothetical protein
MIDVLFVIPNSSKKIYQSLANNFSAIEPPTWALLLASSMLKNNFSCEILDCDALRLNEEESIAKIKESKTLWRPLLISQSKDKLWMLLDRRVN